MNKVLNLLALTFLFNLWSCEKKSRELPVKTSNLLATISDKSIMVNDFIKRCEYVPRPVYCRANNYIHKKIALNSLIAEKLLSLEFDKENLQMSEAQKSIVKGQEEQAMRLLMLKSFGYDSVKVDLEKVRKLVSLDQRTYDVRFVTFEQKYNKLISLQSKNISLNELIKKINSTPKSENKLVRKNDGMLDKVHDVLFRQEPFKKQFYGPFKLNKDQIICFEINSWTTSIDVTEKAKKERWDSVYNQYEEEEVLKRYGSYVKRLMKGKSLNYNPEIFEIFSNKLRKIYLIEKEKKEAVINNKIWEINDKTEITSFADIQKINSEVLLKHESDDYTVQELLNLIKKHPLVFRNKRTNKELFSNELKYAIADLFRDFHITKKAYDLGYDENQSIKIIKEKWNDHIKSTIYKKEYFGLQNDKSASLNILSNKIDSLQILYSDVIKIDTDKFEKIQLSSIDMNVNYSNQAYTKLEPSFPILTDDHLLDYGQKFSFDDL